MEPVAKPASCRFFSFGSVYRWVVGMETVNLPEHSQVGTYYIAVSNQKGGVAKTTTSVSLGAALGENGARVLLVDLDAQANLTMSLGFDPRAAGLSIIHVLLQAAPLEQVIRPTQMPNLDLVPSSMEMEKAERFLPIRKDYTSILRKRFKVQLPYDYVIFDCPPALGATTMNALNTADLLIIPTQAEYFSVSGLRNMLDTIQRVRGNGNPGLVYRILLTMYDRRTKVHRRLRKQLKETFQEGLFDTWIDIDTKLRESSAAGEPIHNYHGKSRSAQQYQSLAEELFQNVTEFVVQPA